MEDSSTPAFLDEISEEIRRQRVLPLLNHSVYLNYLETTDALAKKMEVIGSTVIDEREIKNPEI